MFCTRVGASDAPAAWPWHCVHTPCRLIASLLRRVPPTRDVLVQPVTRREAQHAPCQAASEGIRPRLQPPLQLPSADPSHPALSLSSQPGQAVQICMRSFNPNPGTALGWLRSGKRWMTPTETATPASPVQPAGDTSPSGRAEPIHSSRFSPCLPPRCATGSKAAFVEPFE